ncbi:MAG: NAD(P)-dependent oxidoreductase [Pseudomonadota bacterium]
MGDKPTVGFIGVGLMGWGMAKNAVDKGFPLRVMAHRKREAVDDLVGRGAVECPSAEAMAAECDIIVLCVTGSPEVEANVAEILKTARPGLTIIDSTTADPTSTARLAAELAEHDITLVDAPLSRTPAHAWEGELTTYVGGDAETLARIRPLLETWASVIVPTNGPVGSAHAVKLINNLIAVGYASIWAEAFSTLEQIGVAPAVLHEIVSNSGMTCGNYQNWAKYALEGDSSAHKFALANCHKDMDYYARLARSHRVPTLVSAGVLQTMTLGLNMGYGERYMPETLEIFRALRPPSQL